MNHPTDKPERYRLHRRHVSLGFTLIETLLALAVGALILTGASALIYTSAQLAMLQHRDDSINLHAAQVSYFLRATLNNRAISAAPSSNAPSTARAGSNSSQSTGFTWQKPENLPLGNNQILSFKLNEAPPVLHWLEHSIPSPIQCYLYFSKDEGLSLLWTPLLAELQIGDSPPLYQTLLSEKVSKVTYAYYDAVNDRWEIEEDTPDTKDKPLPTLLVIEFTQSDETITEQIALPELRDFPVP